MRGSSSGVDDDVSSHGGGAYDGRCRSVAPADAAARAAAGEPHVVRFRVPRRTRDGATGGVVVVKDEIKGVSRFPLDTIDDFVLLKADGFPTCVCLHAVHTSPLAHTRNVPFVVFSGII